MDQASRKEYNRAYYQANKKRMDQNHKEYVRNNIEEVRKYHNQRNKQNRKTYYKYIDLVRRAINYGYGSRSKANDILGCSYIEYMEYLKNKFESWMNFDNRGYNGKMNEYWDIDHIIPLSSAKNDEEIIKLLHYSNTQPLCSFTNRYIKKDKI